MSPPTTTPLLTLPSELVEAVLISSRSPRTVAAIAQTCRTLRTLVYTSPDAHLWRELFLTTWDDPRPALEHRALVDPRVDPAAWDWGTEYRRRVSADRWLKAWRRDISHVPPSRDDDAPSPTAAATTWQAPTTTALAALLDTLLTLTPFPAAPPIALKVLTPTATSQISPYPTGNAGSGLGDRRERMTSAPPLPPLLIVLATRVAAFERSRGGRRVGRVVFGPHATRPQAGAASDAATQMQMQTQTAALDARARAGRGVLPTPALPPQMVRTLLASYEVGVRGVPAHRPSLTGAGRWAGDALGDVFHRIVCITGFVPIPPPLGSCVGAGAASAARRAPEEEEEGKEGDDVQVFPLPYQQYADARVLARRRVYDMQYLRGDRLWGPYQTVTRISRDGPSGATRTRKRSHKGGRTRDGLGTLAWAMGAEIEPDEFDVDDLTSDDSKDEDWRDVSDHAGKQSSNSNQDTMDADLDTDTEPMEPEHPLISLILASTVVSENDVPTSRRRTRRSNPRLPPNCSVNPCDIKPHHLRPDYAYLASVRIVVEANLRELFGNEVHDDGDQVASAVWPGAVGMFWEDEDELLRVRAGSGEPASSSSHVLSATPSGIRAATNTNTFELADILAEFKNIEVARLGSACGYWGGWIEVQQADADAMASEGDPGVRKPRIVADRAVLEQPVKQEDKGNLKGKGKERERTSAPDDGLGDWEVGPEGEACEGWDWAGVAGIWRRCVCWMDYRELLFFNLDSSKFLTLDTQEACRIIPMELRITGYTRAGLIPVYDTDARNNINIFSQDRRSQTSGICTGYFRPPPVIHFLGASVGSDRGMDDGRRVKGCVQLIGGGEVRWQMDTYTQESDLARASTPEWASEAVQVGGLGSAVGVLGMWTGAGHERADPLGPFWAWKVT